MRAVLRHAWRFLWRAMLLATVLVVLFTGTLETGPGQALARRAISHFAGIELAGLSGSPLRRTTLSGIVLRDQEGAWLRIDRVALAWNPLALATRVLRVEALEITGASLLRLPQGPPESTTTAAPASAAFPARLPVALDIASLRITDARIAAALSDTPAPTTLNAQAHVSLDRAVRGEGSLAIVLSGNGDGHISLDWRRSQTITARLVVAEPQGGFLARLAGLPALGALGAEASIDGLASAAAVDARLTAAAGVTATVTGTLDALGGDNDLHLTAHADAGALAVLLADAARIDGADASLRLTGALADPIIAGTLTAPAISAAGARLDGVHAALSTRPGSAARMLEATLTAQAVTPPAPVAPLGAARVTARGLLHPDGTIELEQLGLENARVVLTAQGRMAAQGAPAGEMRVTVPSLRALLPESGMGGAVSAKVVAGQDGALALDATLDAVEGPGPLAVLLGPHATLVAAGRLGPAMQLDRLRLDGQAIALTATGALSQSVMLDATLDLPLLTALAPELYGSAQLHIAASGPRTDPAIALELEAPRIGVADLPAGTLRLDATVLRALSAPDATINATGTLAGAPITAALRLLPQPDGALQLPQATFTWGDMRVTASGQVLPDGRPDLTATLAVPSLALPGQLVGQDIAGGIIAEARLRPEEAEVGATLQATGTALRLPGATIRQLSVRATATDALRAPRLDATVEAQDLAAGGVTTAARLTAQGALDALALALALDGTDHRLRGEAQFSLPGTLRISTLTARWKTETVRLVAPATLTLQPEPSVDRLVLALGHGGQIEARGRAGATIDATLTARRLPLALAGLVVPDLSLAGSLDAEARITGPASTPEGQARLTVRGVGLPGTPRADIDANVVLATGTARIDARVRSGLAMRLALAATVPLSDPLAADGALTGTIDLRLLDVVLAPQGRQARGMLRLDLRARDRALGGSAQLAQASFSDGSLGFRLDGITGGLTANGQMLRVALAARAGEGRIALDGTVLPFDAALPVDLRLTATDASLAIGTRLSTRLGADLRMEGSVAGGLRLGGRLDVARADIRLPERLPPDIVVLPVRVLGTPQRVPDTAAESAAPGMQMTLDVALAAPRAVFLHGQGLDAELGGSMRIAGTATDPRLAGSLELRTGTLQRLGQTFNFRRGSIDFDGAAGFSPVLDFEAERRLPDITALVRVAGRPEALSIKLASEPELPSDEVLSRILFGRQQNGLTPSQLVQLASAAAELAGLTTPGGGVVDKLRERLGLDRLSAGAADGGGVEVEAGSYVADGVYLGARQRSDGSSQATIQLEVLPGVRLEADVGGAANDRVGASIGFDY